MKCKYKIRSLNVQCAIMRMFGILPMKGCSKAVQRWIANGILVILLFNVLGKLIYIYKFSPELSFWRKVSNVNLWYYQTYTFFMYLSLYVDSEGILTLKQHVEGTFYHTSSEETKKIIRSSRRKEQTFCLVAALAMISLVALALFAYLFVVPKSSGLSQSTVEYFRREGKRYPENQNVIKNWFPFDETVPPWPEILNAIGISLFLSCTVLLYIFITFVPLVGFHVQGQFQILLHQIASLSGDLLTAPVSSATSDERHDVVYKKIRDLVEHHQLILRFCHEYSVFCRAMLLVRGTFCSIYIASTVMLTSSMISNPKLIPFIVSQIIFAMLDVFMFCYFGEMFIQNSQKVSSKLYSVKWYDFPQRSKQLIRIMHLRAQKPARLTLFKRFIVVGIHLMVQILRASYSVCALLIEKNVVVESATA